MTVIGEAFIKLLPDDSSFRSSVTRDIDAAASSASSNLQKTLGGTIRGVAAKGAGLLAGGLAIRKTVDYLHDSIDAAAEAETQQLKLENAYEKFPQLVNGNIAVLRALNAELAKKTVFDDDSFAAAEAQLAQFKLTEEQISQLIPLVADFAARTGRDVPSSANTLARAILGQGRALKEVGINFEDTGTSAGNLEELMDGLSEKVGGFAEKQAKSAAGRSAQLSKNLGELSESIGNLLIPFLQEVVPPLTSFVEFLTGLPGPIKAAAGALIGAGGLVFALGKVKGILTDLKGLSTASSFAKIATSSTGAASGMEGFGAAANPVVAIAALGAINVKLWSDNFRDMSRAQDLARESINSSTPIVKAYTDNLIANGGTHEQLVERIKLVAAGLKSEGASVEELAQFYNAATVQVRRFDASLQETAADLQALAAFAQNLDTTIDHLNLTVGRPGAPGGTPTGGGSPSGGGRGSSGGGGGGGGSGSGGTSSGEKGIDVTVSVDGSVLQRSQRNDEILLDKFVGGF